MRKEQSVLCSRIDPRISILGLLVMNFAAFFTSSMTLMAAMVVFDCVLMVVVGKWKAALGWLCGYLVVYWGGVGLILLGPAFQGFAICFVYLSRMFPIAMFAALMISTTFVGEMAYALQAFGLPSRFTVAVCVALRFFPTVAREAKAVHEAMLTRGMRLTPLNIAKHPLVLIENFFVPFIHRISTTADELGNAVMVRGIETSNKRTCYHLMKIGVFDVTVLMGTICFLVLGIVGRFA